MGIRRRTKFVQVHEDVWKTIIAPDEAVALLVVEPLDVSFCSFSHRLIPSD